ncbi:MAG: hypothetical protein J7500_01955 [Sphingomonas sp.]|uniref:hypothetical protein n=1 Tax=Sphingomonas sp. TaxID=28214 RepID=UPI001B2AACCD|nr:hypothetical protein [Sphingomonas sp.]MBO9621454.1 hypothetical protein [Sphingomonas sp.]
MDLDALLTHYFGTEGLDDPVALERGIERLGTDFAVEQEPGRRFALWALLHALGAAPDPDVAFEDPELRAAARDYAWAADKAADRAH